MLDLLIREIAPDDIQLTLFVITEKPLDFPHEFVCRRQFVLRDRSLVIEAEPLARSFNLEGLRMQLPPGLVMLNRDVNDDPVIREIWL